MTVQRDDLTVAGIDVVAEAESVLEGTPVEPIPAPPTGVPWEPKREPEPEITPMCCGGKPIPPLYGSGEPLIMHEPTCKNYQG